MDSVLGLPLKIGERLAPNRFFVHAFECCNADAEGNPTEDTYRRYHDLMEGEFGIVCLEAATVTYSSRSKLRQLSVMPRNQKALEKFFAEMKKINKDCLFIVQLTHAGELSNPVFSHRVTPKPIYGWGGDVIDEEYIEETMKQFEIAAKIVHDAGADGIDFKICHGYLFSQLLRPYNDRNWKYGGSWENRSRAAFETFERISRAVNDPRFIMSSKVSLWEGFPGGQGSAGPDSSVMDLTESLDLIKGLEDRGLNLLIQSAGGAQNLQSSQPIREAPGWVWLHHYFAKECKRVLKPKTAVVGSGYSIFGKGRSNLLGLPPEKRTFEYWAEKNVREGNVDAVALGRQSMADPLFAKKYLNGDMDKIHWCTTCENCEQLLIYNQKVNCCVYEKGVAERVKKLAQFKDKDGLFNGTTMLD